MWVFHFHARASLNRLTRKIPLQISSLATEKVQRPGALRSRDPYPTPPQRNLQKEPGRRAAPGSPGARCGRSGSQRGEDSRGRPGYLMLPLGRGLLFHFCHKRARHLPLHRAQAPHGEPDRQREWRARLGTAADPSRERGRQPRSSHAHSTPRRGGGARVPRHGACGRDVRPEAYLAAVPSGSCSAGADTPPRALPRLLPRFLKKQRSVSGGGCTSPHLVTDDSYDN